MAIEMEINISPIFSTPLLEFSPASHDLFDAELSQLSLQREASVPTYRDDEVVGWSSPHDPSMLDWAGGPLKALMSRFACAAGSRKLLIKKTSVLPD